MTDGQSANENRTDFPISPKKLFSAEEMSQRAGMLVGEEGLKKLSMSRVAVFGLGGVGGACAEALARAGVGKLFLIDNDCFVPSNLNRQIFATAENIGERKAAEAKKRVNSINPFCKAEALDLFFNENAAGLIPWDEIDYICDAIDSVASKVLLAKIAQEKGIGEISCMGTGNKLDPLAFEIADIYRTSVCPLARVMRKLLKEAGVKKLTCVYSREEPVKTGTRTPGSISFVPPVAGYAMAGYVIRKLLSM